MGERKREPVPFKTRPFLRHIYELECELQGHQITKTQFAKAIGISTSAVSDWASWYRSPTLEMILLFWNRYNMDGNELLELVEKDIMRRDRN